MSNPPSRQSSRASREAIRLSVIWIAVVLAVFTLAGLLSPTAGSTLMLPGLGIPLPELCSFRSFLGVDCPGCGLTRSFVLAVRLRFADAWAMHPLGTLLVIYLAASVPQRLWRLQRLLTGKPARSTVIGELALIFCFILAAYLRWTVLWLEQWGR